MIEDYDGLCGIIPTFAHSGNQIRCQYELGHHGPCSFEKYRNQFYIWGGCGSGDWNRSYTKDGVQRGFVASVVSHQEARLSPIIVDSDNNIKPR